VPFEEDEIWRSTMCFQAAGSTVYAPAPTVLLGLLVIHGWKHNWSKLIWIADVAALIRKYPLDWDRLQASATRGGWRRIMLLGLEMAKRIYGVGGPFEADPKILSLTKELESNLRSSRDNSYLDWHRYMLRARDSVTHQTAQLANFTLTPGLAEYATTKLPNWASPAYRAVRLARVLSLWPEKAID